MTPMVDVHQRLMERRQWVGPTSHVPCTSNVDVPLCASMDVYEMYDFHNIVDIAIRCIALIAADLDMVGSRYNVHGQGRTTQVISITSDTYVLVMI